MKTSQHTPGPWFLIEPDYDEVREMYDDGEGCPESCKAYISAAGWGQFAHIAVTLNGDADAEGLANARLIAAAPALLAVAKAYEEWEAAMIMCQKAWAGGMAEFPTLTAELWDRLMAIQAMRNAAIRKAVSGG